jgi:phage shock protein PspC (stress-responsive transcriptional regulator)
MTHSPFAPPRPPRFHRIEGPFGGVAAGLGSTFGFSPNLLRLALVAITLLTGLVAPALYLALWFVLPEDPALPAERSPGRPPRSLVVILAVLYAVGTILDISLGLVSFAFSLLPLALVALAVVALVSIWRRSSSQHAVR